MHKNRVLSSKVRALFCKIRALFSIFKNQNSHPPLTPPPPTPSSPLIAHMLYLVKVCWFWVMFILLCFDISMFFIDHSLFWIFLRFQCSFFFSFKIIQRSFSQNTFTGRHLLKVTSLCWIWIAENWINLNIYTLSSITFAFISISFSYQIWFIIP